MTVDEYTWPLSQLGEAIAELGQRAGLVSAAGFPGSPPQVCHTDPDALKGIYGTDVASVRKLISEGGNNIMSMLAYKDRISAADIELITTYLMQQKDWN